MMGESDMPEHLRLELPDDVNRLAIQLMKLFDELTDEELARVAQFSSRSRRSRSPRAQVVHGAFVIGMNYAMAVKDAISKQAAAGPSIPGNDAVTEYMLEGMEEDPVEGDRRNQPPRRTFGPPQNPPKGYPPAIG